MTKTVTMMSDHHNRGRNCDGKNVTKLTKTYNHGQIYNYGRNYDQWLSKLIVGRNCLKDGPLS